MFTEWYAATTGERWIRPDLAGEALRIGRVLVSLVPREPEARAGRPDGTPGLAVRRPHPARRHPRAAGRPGPDPLGPRADGRGRAALARADGLGRGRGNYALQAAIAECHAVAPSVDRTDWAQIVLLYEALGRIAPSPVVELNRAVAVSMATGPATALAIVDGLVSAGALRGSHLLPSVRAELLARLGRPHEARSEFAAAAALAKNNRERDVLERKAAATPSGVCD